MTKRATFIGGPLDGQIMPDADREWYFHIDSGPRRSVLDPISDKDFETITVSRTAYKLSKLSYVTQSKDVDTHWFYIVEGLELDDVLEVLVAGYRAPAAPTIPPKGARAGAESEGSR
jgi:hypothetical protein